jgi:predicted transcriptional regulator
VITTLFEGVNMNNELKNRNKVDIIYDILASAVDGGVKKTHIMYRANLSSEQMKFYFHTLVSHSLLSTDKDSEDNSIYKTTQKGFKFLQCCIQIKSLISQPANEKICGKARTSLFP